MYGFRSKGEPLVYLTRPWLRRRFYILYTSVCVARPSSEDFSMNRLQRAIYILTQTVKGLTTLIVVLTSLALAVHEFWAVIYQ